MLDGRTKLCPFFVPFCTDEKWQTATVCTLCTVCTEEAENRVSKKLLWFWVVIDGVGWKSVWFGSRKSEVQILSPRPISSLFRLFRTSQISSFSYNPVKSIKMFPMGSLPSLVLNIISMNLFEFWYRSSRRSLSLRSQKRCQKTYGRIGGWMRCSIRVWFNPVWRWSQGFCEPDLCRAPLTSKPLYSLRSHHKKNTRSLQKKFDYLVSLDYYVKYD